MLNTWVRCFCSPCKWWLEVESYHEHFSKYCQLINWTWLEEIKSTQWLMGLLMLICNVRVVLIRNDSKSLLCIVFFDEVFLCLAPFYLTYFNTCHLLFCSLCMIHSGSLPAFHHHALSWCGTLVMPPLSSFISMMIRDVRSDTRTSTIISLLSILWAVWSWASQLSPGVPVFSHWLNTTLQGYHED